MRTTETFCDDAMKEIRMAVGFKNLKINFRRRLGCWIVIVPFVLVAIYIAVANAHDAHRPDLDDWFKQLKSKNGDLCCSGTDGTALSDVDWRSKDGRYQVRLEGQWIDVPEGAVITEPNRAGRTMVWPVRGYYAGLTVRCFMPGPGA
jgi:hypothetical protein